MSTAIGSVPQHLRPSAIRRQWRVTTGWRKQEIERPETDTARQSRNQTQQNGKDNAETQSRIKIVAGREDFEG